MLTQLVPQFLAGKFTVTTAATKRATPAELVKQAQAELAKLEEALESSKTRLKELKIELKSSTINGDNNERRKLKPKVDQAESDIKNLTEQIENAQKELKALESSEKESKR
jgi:septal ring factor EnvC (AmiA/AmiB activator)